MNDPDGDCIIFPAQLVKILVYPVKAELLQAGILFSTQFPSLGIFINKKVEFRKN